MNKKKIKNIEILHETDDYLIINKPAGLIVHEAHTSQEETVCDLVVERYPEIKNVGDDQKRPGIVHRLDREVSGIMVIAKSSVFFEYIKNEFQNRKIEKAYEAIVHGLVIKDEGRINFPIVRAKSGHKMAALPMPKKEVPAQISNREQGNEKARIDSKEAVTDFRVIKKWPHISLLSINILTGRTHQIRVHLSAFGHPLLGDQLYGTPKSKRKNDKLNLGRIFLFAKRLSFTDMKGENQSFEIARPKEMQDFLNKQK